MVARAGRRKARRSCHGAARHASTVPPPRRPARFRSSSSSPAFAAARLWPGGDRTETSRRPRKARDRRPRGRAPLPTATASPSLGAAALRRLGGTYAERADAAATTCSPAATTNTCPSSGRRCRANWTCPRPCARFSREPVMPSWLRAREARRRRTVSPNSASTRPLDCSSARPRAAPTGASLSAAPAAEIACFRNACFHVAAPPRRVRGLLGVAARGAPRRARTPADCSRRSPRFPATRASSGRGGCAPRVGHRQRTALLAAARVEGRRSPRARAASRASAGSAAARDRIARRSPRWPGARGLERLSFEATCARPRAPRRVPSIGAEHLRRWRRVNPSAPWLASCARLSISLASSLSLLLPPLLLSASSACASRSAFSARRRRRSRRATAALHHHAVQPLALASDATEKASSSSCAPSGRDELEPRASSRAKTPRRTPCSRKRIWKWACQAPLSTIGLVRHDQAELLHVDDRARRSRAAAGTFGRRARLDGHALRASRARWSLGERSRFLGLPAMPP